MPPTAIKQEAFWPGAGAISSASYTCVHGITPGSFTIQTIPQYNLVGLVSAPSMFGNLVFSDGVRQNVTIRSCKVAQIDPILSNGGTSFRIRGEDRRWKWRGPYGAFGAISGRYNRLDTRAKYVPWSIRSPIELATLCFQALGETRFTINLPVGLSRKDGENFDRFLRLGERFEMSTANPEIVWDYTPPAEALAQIADTFGCRLVYLPIADSYSIIPVGVGRRDFGRTPNEVQGAAFQYPSTPRAVAVVGAAIRSQVRFATEPVGEEWDGSIIPIDDLSYAPLAAPGAKQSSTITWTVGPGTRSRSLRITVNVSDTENKNLAGSYTETLDCGRTGGDDATALLIAELFENAVDALFVHVNIAVAFALDADDNVLTITAKNQTGRISVTAEELDDTDEGGGEADQNRYSVATTAPGFAGGRSWRSCPPSTFRGVQATERLAYLEALGLAQKYVFRAFRIVNRDPDDPSKKLTVPPLKKPLKRIQQVILQPEKVEQVIPMPRIAGGNNRGNPFLPPNGPAQAVLGGLAEVQPPLQGGILPEFYNGYSRCQQATATGSIYKGINSSILYNVQIGDAADTMNTKPNDRIWVNFQIVTSPGGDTLIVFDEPIYARESPGPDKAYIKYPEVVVETGCLVCDEDTDQAIRYEKELKLPGGVGNVEWHRHEDCQVGVVSKYAKAADDGTGGNRSIGWEYAHGDVRDARKRADFYLTYHARRYITQPGAFLQAIGIYGFDMDGAVQQITWSVGGGATTHASINHEYSPYTPSYPQRRRNENLAPDPSARLANLKERDFFNRIYPKPGGQAR